MKATRALLSTLFLAPLPSAFASDGLTIIPSVAFQMKTLSFDQTYSGFDENSAEFSTTLPVLNLSVTAVMQKFFVSAKYESSLADVSSATNETDRSGVDQPNLIAHEASDVDVERKDWSLTFGYNVWDSLNIFVGYLDGETTLTPEPFCGTPLSDPTCVESNRAFFQFFIGDAGLADNQAVYEQLYEENGFFGGVSYGLSLEGYGTLTMSAAYASMDGQYRDNANDPNEGFDGTFVPFNFEGDSTGFSLGLTWTGALGENTAYFLDLRRQSYSMSAVDSSSFVVPGRENLRLRTDEEMTGFTAGIQVYFDIL
ncbi:MAG: hypothetical protein COA42_14880 [Alteromonadaceae bacterium]|nr:MAG: hypothetical protein COA42_14880 [Alteromonadaceae bacterium]